MDGAGDVISGHPKVVTVIHDVGVAHHAVCDYIIASTGGVECVRSSAPSRIMYSHDFVFDANTSAVRSRRDSSRPLWPDI